MTKQTLIGQLAVVTRPAHGIGLAIAHKFAAEGAKLVVTDLHDDAIGCAADVVRAKN